VEFGQAELAVALAARNIKARNQVDLNTDAPETYRIEPLGGNSAHISGGDLRGLMYGLLEAAEQIRTNGKFAKVRGVPATRQRGVLLHLTETLEARGEPYWRAYFQMLARNRFNRVHVVFRHLAPPYGLERMLSQAAADYGLDFTLGIQENLTAGDILSLLVASPSIRNIAIEPESESRDAAIEAIQDAGRRVTLESDGKAVSTSGAPLPVVRPPTSWPPNFEADIPLDPSDPNAHSSLYWLWGRLAYDPKTKLPKDANADQYAAALDAVTYLAASDQSRSGGSEYVAAIPEAIRNRREQLASAKFTPLDIAARLDRAAMALSAALSADLQILAERAMAEATSLRRAYQVASQADAEAVTEEAALATVPKPTIAHTPQTSAPSEQPLDVKLKLADPKDLTLVRLHYRPLLPSSYETILEKPASAEMIFTIPGTELNGNWDLQYYFEILHKSGSGWFEPDPATGMPYVIVHIVAPRSGPN
jgi:hypothetical protein